MRALFLCLCLYAVCNWLIAQDQPAYTPADQRLQGFDLRTSLIDSSLAHLEFRNAGPSVFSGRVTDIAVNPSDPTEFYVAYASGGLWKTTNNGMSFEPLMDDQAVMTIGDIAVDWKRGTLYVGTGENNSSRSSYSGMGALVSKNEGASWQHIGLEESHHISRILLDPRDSNTLIVAVLGHLYSPNSERGIYRTTDGGRSWQKTLYVDENTGGVDLIRDPNDADILYAATWDRERRAWNFVESGAGSGIYKSKDGGQTWTLVSTSESGFPTGEGVGRIGLTVGQFEDGDQTLYALVDNYDRRKEEPSDDEELTKKKIRAMSTDSLLALENEDLKRYLRGNGFPPKYTAEKVKDMLRDGEITVEDIAAYREDANSLLFDTPVIGGEVYRSTDGGTSWQKTHEGFIDDFYYSYGYYFGQIRTPNSDPRYVYIMGVPILRSDDGGETFTSINEENVHVDHHALWINPDRHGHMILGNDGGINITYDDGETWIKCNSPAVGQFYTVNVDLAEPYNIYGGTQDNGVWMGSSTYAYNRAWEGTGRYGFKKIMGGDGMQIAIDPRDNETVYTGFQFGHYYRLNTKKGKSKKITPQHDLGEPPYRWNWQTPIQLSTHHPDILYMGANVLFRSLNQGSDFEPISNDLTNGGAKGDVAYGTLTSISESPKRFGLIYTGSDDGKVYRTHDGGYEWTDISDNLPERMWVSRVYASHHSESRIYLALNGYRWDDFTPYVYVSDDFGDSWTSIATGLPLEPINVIKEDPVNEDILYVGTDHALYVSLDRGWTYFCMNNNMPYAPVHDLVIHPRENDLVVGTHGRSFYVADVEHLQQLDSATLAKPLVMFDLNEIKHQKNWGKVTYTWRDPAVPEVKIPVFSQQEIAAYLQVRDDKGHVLFRRTDTLSRGLQHLKYDLSVPSDIVSDAGDESSKPTNAKKRKKKNTPFRYEVKKADNGKYYLLPGTYTISLKAGAYKAETSLLLKGEKPKEKPVLRHP